MVSRSRSNTASMIAAPMPLPGEIGKPRAHGLRPARDGREVDEADLRLALARQHPHQVGIVHRVERMVLQRALVQRHGADEQIAQIDGAAGFRERPASPARSRSPAIGAQRVHDRTDIAGVGGIEGRADLEHHMARAAAAQPILRRARARRPRGQPRSSGSSAPPRPRRPRAARDRRRARRWSAWCAGQRGSACWRDRRRRYSRRRCSRASSVTASLPHRA